MIIAVYIRLSQDKGSYLNHLHYLKCGLLLRPYPSQSMVRGPENLLLKQILETALCAFKLGSHWSGSKGPELFSRLSEDNRIVFRVLLLLRQGMD